MENNVNDVNRNDIYIYIYNIYHLQKLYDGQTLSVSGFSHHHHPPQSTVIFVFYNPHLCPLLILVQYCIYLRFCTLVPPPYSFAIYTLGFVHLCPLLILVQYILQVLYTCAPSLFFCNIYILKVLYRQMPRLHWQSNEIYTEEQRTILNVLAFSFIAILRCFCSSWRILFYPSGKERGVSEGVF